MFGTGVLYFEGTIVVTTLTSNPVFSRQVLPVDTIIMPCIS